MLSEEEVYNGAKRILTKNNYVLLAGQPPRGVDHLPVVEIKSGTNKDKGSKGSFKPDLVAYKDNILLIIECKPNFNTNDLQKLHEVLTSNSRLLAFYNELSERGLFNKIDKNINFDKFKEIVFGSIAYSSNPTENNIILESSNLYTVDEANNKIYQIIVNSWLGNGYIIEP
ncbi:hypothetical protein PTM93_08580 [Clostridium perfringens]|uniref:hypothetical protein n=1 Tax=Clostridium perfringens TaxID=1502 RepID=UPI000D7135EC|nr:hypothetical protein [Clostridium perfringens]EGT2191543.1 hypothetical protein [Clostridium perfringens]MCC5433711.1 hypothetical protein [Clostridium perfringens]MCC5435940.1 hypothetical protein [Clostridium perfringens]MCC5446196.1 hypothetical protein [Clostridium perfringens]MCC5449141.1 hypothetical protein [Clostridium perfringens]